MIIYKKWKNLKPDVKVGLACTAFYFASLATPIYAAVEQELNRVEPTNLEQITTSEKAKTLYKEKIMEYSSDNIFEVDEIRNLYGINKKETKLLGKEKTKLENQLEVNTNTDDLDKQILRYEEKLEEGAKVSVFEPVRKKLEMDVLSYYEGLMAKDGKWNIVYSAETKLHPGLNPVMKEVITEIDKIMKQYNKDSNLGLFFKKDEYKIQDILALYGLMDRKDYFDNVAEDDTKNKLAMLRQRKEDIIDSEQNTALKKKIAVLDETLEKNSDATAYFKAYFDYKEEIKEFEAKYGNANNDWAHSFIKSVIYEGKGLRPSSSDRFNALEIKEKEFKGQQKAVVLGLESYLNSQELLAREPISQELSSSIIRVEELGNPATKKFPWWLGTFVMGMGAPIIRNLIIKGYTRGRNVYNEGEYFAAGIAGLGNGVVGMVFLDGLHPFVFPARMLTPLVLQPFFKLIDWDPARSFAK
ncbi:MAG: hypothetical protein KKA79_09980 [Nanoarchaeota archaeon]|nr:hypothetical protein [Nanoarchaeota archaeon]MCG2717981.1 hypothetical protein [Nanoarchaeota archaeon]